MLINNLKYVFAGIVVTPLLPLMYVQGKKIRDSVPRLPEAEGPEGKAQAPSPANSTKTLFTLGESTIAGVGVDRHEHGFSGTLATKLAEKSGNDVAWKVYARSGYTAKRVTEKLVPRMDQESPDLIVIGLGGNDAFTLNSPWSWRRDIKALIEKLNKKFPGTALVFCNMPPIKEFPAFTSLIQAVVGNLVNLLGKTLDELSQEYDFVYYLNEQITFKGWIEKYDQAGEKEDFFSDGVHPAPITYEVWAEEVAQFVIERRLL